MKIEFKDSLFLKIPPDFYSELNYLDFSSLWPKWIYLFQNLCLIRTKISTEPSVILFMSFPFVSRTSIRYFNYNFFSTWRKRIIYFNTELLFLKVHSQLLNFKQCIINNYYMILKLNFLRSISQSIFTMSISRFKVNSIKYNYLFSLQNKDTQILIFKIQKE